MSLILSFLFFVVSASAGAACVLIASQPPGENILTSLADQALRRKHVWVVAEATGSSELQTELNRLERDGYTIGHTFPLREEGHAACILAFRRNTGDPARRR